MTDLQNFVTLNKRLTQLEQDIEQATITLKQLARERDNLKLVEIPELMNELDVPKINISMDGKDYEISRKENFYASISKDRKPLVVEWLRANGHDGLIRNELIADVPKGKDNVASEAYKILEDLGFNVTRETNVHTGSFKALVKDELEKGSDVPLEELGVNRVVEAVIKELK